MALANWPATVPFRSDLDGWSNSLGAPSIVADVEGPNDEQRSRPGDAIEVLQWQKAVTRAQYALLKVFVASTLRNGAARFWMPVCLDRVAYEIRTVMIEPGSFAASGINNAQVRVSMTLRVLPAVWVPPVPVITGVAGATVSGTAPAGASVELLIGSLSMTTSASGGVWAVEPALLPGVYDVLARAYVGGVPGPWTIPRSLTIGFQAVTSALLARMSVQPTTARASAINRLYVDLSLAGVLAKLDLFYVMAAHDAQAARLNWVPWTGVVTNLIRNNAMLGVGAGVRPTGWVAPFTSATGITITPVGGGVEDGIDYSDWDITGTASVDGTVFLYCWGSVADIPAAPGQIYSGSLFCKVASGSLAGTTWAGGTGANGVFLTPYNSAPAAIGGGQNTVFTPPSAPLAQCRFASENWTTPANTAYVAMYIRFQVTAGIPINLRLRIGWPQMVRMDVAGNPIRTTGAAASETQTLQRFALTPAGAPGFVVDRGYAGGSGTYLATNYNPATDGVGYAQNYAHLAFWDLTNRAAGDIIPVGLSTGTGVQVGALHRYSTDRCAFSVNDQSSTFANTRSDGFFVGSRLSSAARSVYRDGALLAEHAAASMAVPSLPVDLLCFKYNNGANRGYWCTDRIAVFTMGAGLTSTEVAAYHAALRTYLQTVGAVA